MGDTYPYNNETAGTAKRSEDEELHHNMQMICYIKKEEDANRSDLINMEVFKPMSKNATK